MTLIYDVAVVGGGAVGCAVARALSARLKDAKLVLIEKEKALAAHTSGRNSGVLHSPIHLRPGSLKAKLCAAGSEMIKRYCRARGLPCKEVGKLIVANSAEEAMALRTLLKYAAENGVRDVKLIDQRSAKELEPYANCLEALYSPHDAIIDPVAYVRSLGEDAVRNGAKALFGTRVDDVEPAPDGTLRLRTPRGELRTKFLINCGGLYADRIAHKCGVGTQYTIIPIRGEYYRVIDSKRHIVKGLVYPTPSPGLPFLGIHFTKTIDGGILVGPNAVPAFGRESYGPLEINPIECMRMLFSKQLVQALRGRGMTGLILREFSTSLNKAAFLRAARRLVPHVALGDLVKDRRRTGIRAQLVNSSGRLVEDFVLELGENSAHVLNAVSPGLTSSMAFGEYLADGLLKEGLIGSQMLGRAAK